jgi:hypothetical protein
VDVLPIKERFDVPAMPDLILHHVKCVATTIDKGPALRETK